MVTICFPRFELFFFVLSRLHSFDIVATLTKFIDHGVEIDNHKNDLTPFLSFSIHLQAWESLVWQDDIFFGGSLYKSKLHRYLIELQLESLTMGWLSRIQSRGFYFGLDLPSRSCWDENYAITIYHSVLLVPKAILDRKPNVQFVRNHRAFSSCVIEIQDI